MISPIVPPLPRSETKLLQPSQAPAQRMDPLSEVLALLKPQSLASGGFMVPGDMAIYFPKHQGIKCYAMLAGQCWLVVEGVPAPVLLEAGDCFLLPRRMPFQLTTDLSLKPTHYALAWGRLSKTNDVPAIPDGARYITGGFFGFTGSHAEMLLHSLLPIIHIRRESDKAAMRWALEPLREELRNPQPGSSLIAQSTLRLPRHVRCL